MTKPTDLALDRVLGYAECKKLLVDTFGISPEYSIELVNVDRLYRILPPNDNQPAYVIADDMYKAMKAAISEINLTQRWVTLPNGRLAVATFAVLHDTRTVYLKVTSVMLVDKGEMYSG